MRKKRRSRHAGVIVIITAVVVLTVAVWNLAEIFLNYKESEDTYRELSDDYTEPDGGEGLEPWKMVDIDFDALRAINPDVVGWIRFDDTDAVNVDYPIMYSEEPDKYLHENLYGEYYYAGSIFLEENNSPDFSDVYNIVYGHNMRNGTMLGTLRQFRDSEDFYEANKYFTIYTPDAAYRYEIFAYANVPEDSGIYTTGYVADEIYGEFVERIAAGSMKDTGIVPGADDRVVTLSTCTSAGRNYRFVVSAVCVEKYCG